MLQRDRYLPPSQAQKYATNVSAGQTVTAFTLSRGRYNAVEVYAEADQDILVHVDAGTDFSGTVYWQHRRTYRVKAGLGACLPVNTAAESIRVQVENPGGTATTYLRLSAYLSTVGGMPTLLHPTVPLWSGQVLTAGAGQIYSPVINLGESIGGQVTIQITNGATGPTIPPTVALQASSDGVIFGDYCAFGLMLFDTSIGKIKIFPTINNAVSAQSVVIPTSIKFARIRAGGNTGQNVTISASANLAHY